MEPSENRPPKPEWWTVPLLQDSVNPELHVNVVVRSIQQNFRGAEFKRFVDQESNQAPNRAAIRIEIELEVVLWVHAVPIA